MKLWLFIFYVYILQGKYGIHLSRKGVSRLKFEMETSSWGKMEISKPKDISSLQNKIDAAEKNGEAHFTDFDDLEMIHWYLYRRQHLLERNEKVERTLKEYESELSQFIQYVLQYGEYFNLDIDEIVDGSLFKSLAPRHIRRYQEWLATKSPYVLKNGKYSPATLARKTTVLKTFLQYLYRVGYVKQPLHDGLYTATVRKDDRPDRDLGPRDIVSLLDYYREIEHQVMFTFVQVLTTTGIRNEEFCRLRVGDLKYDAILEKHFLDVLGKGNKRRLVPLREKTYQAIVDFRQARGLAPLTEADAEEALFATNNRRAYSPSYFSQYLSKNIAKTGLSFVAQRENPIGPHTFRHAFAIISRLNKVDLYDIMRSLGHEKLETTAIYLEKLFEKEQHAINSWDEKMLKDYI